MPRFVIVAEAMVNLRQAADCREILRRELEDVLELLLRFLEAADFHQRAAKRHSGRKVRRVPDEACVAGIDRFLILLGAPVFLRKRRERNGRRIQLDPAFQLLYAGVIRHPFRLLHRHRA